MEEVRWLSLLRYCPSLSSCSGRQNTPDAHFRAAPRAKRSALSSSGHTSTFVDIRFEFTVRWPVAKGARTPEKWRRTAPREWEEESEGRTKGRDKQRERETWVKRETDGLPSSPHSQTHPPQRDRQEGGRERGREPGREGGHSQRRNKPANQMEKGEVCVLLTSILQIQQRGVTMLIF
ncbi:hypothetical protein JZ751_027063 [Albula glossodonta]|uniref:Uncharacterized protein n=1 Tax=Albula glossodonta TaxID=121402 RepID=A0A8T2NKB6_9TELE|nr:hypothetical protein JZ751_027063 [Albula glossodonta]